jgi:hypothetical protein
MAALGRHFYSSYGFEKAPWSVGTTMDFILIGLEIWGFGIIQPLEKSSFCGFIAEELLARVIRGHS